MRYKNTDKLIDQIGRELGVAYVIEGGVRRSGNSVRINAQLIQVSDQTQLWDDSYTRDLSDVFAVQAEVAEAVAKALAVELLPQDELAKAATPTANSAAYDAYLLGRSYWAKRTPEAIHTAIGHFERAVKLDPGYALAYSGLADAWSVLPYYEQGDYSAMRAQAQKYATKAVALNASLAETNVSMAHVHSERRDLHGALPFYRKAIALDPNNATARQWHGLNLCLLGRGDEGIAEFERGVALDPMSAVLRLNFGVGLTHARRFEEAIEQLNNAFELQPEFDVAHDDLFWSFVGLGRPDDAARVFEEYLHLLGEPAETARKFRDAYTDSGLCGAITTWLSSIPSDAEIPKMNTGIRAALHAMCGDASRAFELLDQALEEQDPEILYVPTLPAYDDLRDDPRFDAFLQKAGLSKIEIPVPPTTP